MTDKQYKAISPNSSSLLTHEGIDKLAQLSWTAMGIYQHLLLQGIHGTKSVFQLGQDSPKTPYAAISDALDELIALGLVAEVIGAEVVEEGTT